MTTILKKIIKDIKHFPLWDLGKAHYYLSVRKHASEDWFFTSINLTENWKEIDFGFFAQRVLIINDSNDNIEFSWNTEKVDGLLYRQEIVPIDEINKNKINLRGTGSCRIWAY